MRLKDIIGSVSNKLILAGLFLKDQIIGGKPKIKDALKFDIKSLGRIYLNYLIIFILYY